MKATVKMNRWGNWNGYVGGRKVIEFPLDTCGLVATDTVANGQPNCAGDPPEAAKEWLRKQERDRDFARLAKHRAKKFRVEICPGDRPGEHDVKVTTNGHQWTTVTLNGSELDTLEGLLSEYNETREYNSRPQSPDKPDEIVIRQAGNRCEVLMCGFRFFTGGRVAAKRWAAAMHRRTGYPVFNIKKGGRKVAVPEGDL